MYEYYKFMKKKKEASDQIIIQKVNLSGFFLVWLTELKELENCTFHPKISRGPRKKSKSDEEEEAEEEDTKKKGRVTKLLRRLV